MKLLFLILPILSACIANCDAALAITISTNPVSGAYFVVADGTTRIPDGSLVRLGTFDAPPVANADGAALNLSFKEYATTTVGHSAETVANKGMINRTNIPAGTGVAETDFIGRQLYIWVYNAPTAVSATQWGVFTSDRTDIPSPWKFPVDDLPLAAGTLNINRAFGSPGIPAEVSPGTLIYRLSGIPETSTLSLVVLAGLGFTRRRRDSSLWIVSK